MSAAPTVNVDAIPQELQDRPQWVGFRLEHRRGDQQLTKVPHSARNGKKASSTDPRTWSSFNLACKYQSRAHLDGIAFMVSSSDPYTVVDLDHIRDPETGAIDPWAQRIIDTLHTFTEISVSGTGVHLWLKDSPLPSHGRKSSKLPFECYSHARQLTVSGLHLEGTPLTIEARPAEMAAIHLEVFGTAPEPLQTAPRSSTGAPLASDEDVIARCLTRSETFRYLFLGGDIGRYNTERGVPQGQSEADAALVNAIYAVNGRDVEQADRIFRQSPLMRDKWDEPRPNGTYGSDTLAFCLTTRRRTSPQIVSNPPPPPLEEDDHAEALPEAARVQIARLERELAAAQERERQRDARIAEQDERIAWQSEYLTALIAYYRKLGGMAAVGLDLALLCVSATRRGTDPAHFTPVTNAEGLVRFSAGEVAIANYGAPREADDPEAIRERARLTAKVDRGADPWLTSGFFHVEKDAEVTLTPVPYVDKLTGQLRTKTVPARPTRIALAVPARKEGATPDAIDFLRSATTEYQPEERRGGVRKPRYCKEHPHAELIATTTCSVCAALVGEPRKVAPDRPTNSWVDPNATESTPRVVVTLDHQSRRSIEQTTEFDASSSWPLEDLEAPIKRARGQAASPDDDPPPPAVIPPIFHWFDQEADDPPPTLEDEAAATAEPPPLNWAEPEANFWTAPVEEPPPPRATDLPPPEPPGPTRFHDGRELPATPRLRCRYCGVELGTLRTADWCFDCSDRAREDISREMAGPGGATGDGPDRGPLLWQLEPPPPTSSAGPVMGVEDR